jgi:HAD superfamily hydrolase (TIGR01509 family)
MRIIESHSRILKARNIYEPFEHVYLSHEIGLIKPNRSAYEYVLVKLNVKPEEAIFIDDKEENIRGAEKLGIKSILYQNPDQLKHEIEKIIAQ